MKEKILNIAIITLSIISLIELLINKSTIFNTISYSMNLWISSIIPSLFPFFIISDILIQYNITDYIPNPIRKIFKKLFNVSDNSITIFFLSLLSGFPSSARNIRTMYDMNLINEKEASHTLIFTHFSNPLFILGTVSVFFFKNETLGLIILIAHYLSNIILGIITRNYNTISIIDKKQTNVLQKNFPKVFISAIKNAIDNLLTILGTLTCFLIISAMIINTINLSNYNSTILKGILEMTMGLKSLSLLNISDIYKVVISTMFISFGSLSVHMQILSFLIDTKISYKQFFIARIFHALIAGFLSYILYIIIL